MLFILLFAIRSEIPCWSKTRLKIAIWFAFINNVIYLFFLSEKMVTVQSTVDTGHEVMLILPGCAKYTPLLITITIIISNVHILTWMLQERIFQCIPLVKKNNNCPEIFFENHNSVRQGIYIVQPVPALGHDPRRADGFLRDTPGNLQLRQDGQDLWRQGRNILRCGACPISLYRCGACPISLLHCHCPSFASLFLLSVTAVARFASSGVFNLFFML